MKERKKESEDRGSSHTTWAPPPFVAGATGVPGDFTITGDAPVRPTLGRNEPCWCGSGKKYKHCHLNRDLA